MNARVAWQPRDLSPDARRAAEASAEAAGMPLGDWFVETVRSAIIRELGSLPAEDLAPESAEPPSEAPTLAAEPPVQPDQPSSPTPERAAPESRAPVMAVPSVDAYRARRLSLEAQRLADSGLTSWLAARIAGLPPGAAPAVPSTAKAAPPQSPPAPPKPQLDLFPAPPPAAPAPSMASPPAAMLPPSLPTGPVTTLALVALRPARIRSRRSNDADATIAVLAASVDDHGVREPILVRRLAEDAGSYEVVAGERRRLAAERAGRADLPAVVVEADDGEALMLSAAENLGRADFSPLDEGRVYLRLLTEYRVGPGRLAERLSRERSHFALALRLLGLPAKVREVIDSGRLAPAQVYALLSAPDPEAMAEKMTEGGASGGTRGSA